MQESDSSLEQEIEKYRSLNEMCYKEEYATNKERFIVMREQRKKAELDFLKKENVRLQNMKYTRQSIVFRQSEMPTDVQDSTRESKFRPSFRQSTMHGMRNSVFDTTMQIRASVIGFGNDVAKAATNLIPKSAGDAIADARKGFLKVNRLQGPQGEVPIPLAFAHTSRYWELVFWAAFLGATTSFIGVILLVRCTTFILSMISLVSCLSYTLLHTLTPLLLPLPIRILPSRFRRRGTSAIGIMTSLVVTYTQVTYTSFP